MDPYYAKVAGAPMRFYFRDHERAAAAMGRWADEGIRAALYVRNDDGTYTKEGAR